MTREEKRDQVVTTTYILYEIMDDPSFISKVDIAMDIAEEFIKKYPLHTNWEKHNWEESLYTFYHDYLKPICQDCHGKGGESMNGEYQPCLGCLS